VKKLFVIAALAAAASAAHAEDEDWRSVDDTGLASIDRGSLAYQRLSCDPHQPNSGDCLYAFVWEKLEWNGKTHLFHVAVNGQRKCTVLLEKDHEKVKNWACFPNHDAIDEEIYRQVFEQDGRWRFVETSEKGETHWYIDAQTVQESCGSPKIHTAK
jgi:hypothetical protein